METTTPNIAQQWKAFTPEQRTLAMSKMTSDQKFKLASALGYKGKQPAATPPSTPSVQPNARLSVQAAQSPWSAAGMRGMIQHPLNTLEEAAQMHMRPHGETMGEMAATDIGNVAAGAASVIRHPIQTAGGILASGLGARPLVESAENYLLQQMGKAPAHPGAHVIPQSPEEAAYAGGQAAVVAPVAEMARTYGAGKVASAAEKAGQYARPTPSEEIVPPIESASRKLTNAINPHPSAASQFIESAKNQTGNVIDYAKRTRNPLNTRIEFAKAAEGAANESYQHFYNNVLKPVEDDQVSVLGSGYRGATVGEGKMATVKAINDRLDQINRELSPAYRQRNVGVTGAKLASEEELNAEAGNLRSILYKKLSKSSGLTPDEIQEMRQRYGQLRQLARDTDEAVTQKSLGAVKTTESGIGSVSRGSLIGKAIDVARGKTDAIADRMFQRAIKGFPGKATPLKTIVPPEVKAVMRDPIWKGIDTTRVESSISKLSPEQQKAVVQGMEQRLKARKQAIAERTAKEAESRAKNIAAHPKVKWGKENVPPTE